MRNNASGVASPDYYLLGRGKVSGAFLDANGKPLGYRDFGNAPEFNASVEVETLDHYSSREGLRKKDREIVISQDINISFILEEITAQNVALFFSGAVSETTNAAVAGFGTSTSVGAEVVPPGSLEVGVWIDLIDPATGRRAYGVKQADVTVLTVPTGGGAQVSVPYAAGVNYEVDEEMGRVFLKSTSTPLTAAVTAGSGLAIHVAANAQAAGTVSTVTPLARTSERLAIKFLSENANAVGGVTGKSEYNFWNVTLTSDGDLPLISEEWSQMSFNGACTTSTWSALNGETCRIIAL